MIEISVLIKEALECSLVPSTSEDTVRPWPCMNQEVGHHQRFDFELSGLWNCENSVLFVYKPCSLWSFC